MKCNKFPGSNKHFSKGIQYGDINLWPTFYWRDEVFYDLTFGFNGIVFNSTLKGGEYEINCYGICFKYITFSTL